MTPAQFRTWRKNAGLTQSEAARHLGLKAAKTVSRYESGESSIPDEIAAKVLNGVATGEDDPFITPATHPHLYKRERGRYYVNRFNPGFVKTGTARYYCRASELETYVPPPEEPEEPSMDEWIAEQLGRKR